MEFKKITSKVKSEVKNLIQKSVFKNFADETEFKNTDFGQEILMFTIECDVNSIIKTVKTSYNEDVTSGYLFDKFVINELGASGWSKWLALDWMVREEYASYIIANILSIIKE